MASPRSLLLYKHIKHLITPSLGLTLNLQHTSRVLLCREKMLWISGVQNFFSRYCKSVYISLIQHYQLQYLIHL